MARQRRRPVSVLRRIQLSLREKSIKLESSSFRSHATFLLKPVREGTAALSWRVHKRSLMLTMLSRF